MITVNNINRSIQKAANTAELDGARHAVREPLLVKTGTDNDSVQKATKMIAAGDGKSYFASESNASVANSRDRGLGEELRIANVLVGERKHEVFDQTVNMTLSQEKNCKDKIHAKMTETLLDVKDTPKELSDHFNVNKKVTNDKQSVEHHAKTMREKSGDKVEIEQIAINNVKMINQDIVRGSEKTAITAEGDKHYSHKISKQTNELKAMDESILISTDEKQHSKKMTNVKVKARHHSHKTKHSDKNRGHDCIKNSKDREANRVVTSSYTDKHSKLKMDGISSAKSSKLDENTTYDKNDKTTCNANVSKKEDKEKTERTDNHICEKEKSNYRLEKVTKNSTVAFVKNCPASTFIELDNTQCERNQHNKSSSDKSVKELAKESKQKSHIESSLKSKKVSERIGSNESSLISKTVAERRGSNDSSLKSKKVSERRGSNEYSLKSKKVSERRGRNDSSLKSKTVSERRDSNEHSMKSKTVSERRSSSESVNSGMRSEKHSSKSVEVFKHEMHHKNKNVQESTCLEQSTKADDMDKKSTLSEKLANQSKQKHLEEMDIQKPSKIYHRQRSSESTMSFKSDKSSEHKIKTDAEKKQGLVENKTEQTISKDRDPSLKENRKSDIKHRDSSKEKHNLEIKHKDPSKRKDRSGSKHRDQTEEKHKSSSKPKNQTTDKHNSSIKESYPSKEKHTAVKITDNALEHCTNPENKSKNLRHVFDRLQRTSRTTYNASTVSESSVNTADESGHVADTGITVKLPTINKSDSDIPELMCLSERLKRTSRSSSDTSTKLSEDINEESQSILETISNDNCVTQISTTECHENLNLNICGQKKVQRTYSDAPTRSEASIATADLEIGLESIDTDKNNESNIQRPSSTEKDSENVKLKECENNLENKTNETEVTLEYDYTGNIEDEATQMYSSGVPVNRSNSSSFSDNSDILPVDIFMEHVADNDDHVKGRSGDYEINSQQIFQDRVNDGNKQVVHETHPVKENTAGKYISEISELQPLDISVDSVKSDLPINEIEKREETMVKKTTNALTANFPKKSIISSKKRTVKETCITANILSEKQSDKEMNNNDCIRDSDKNRKNRLSLSKRRKTFRKSTTRKKYRKNSIATFIEESGIEGEIEDNDITLTITSMSENENSDLDLLGEVNNEKDHSLAIESSEKNLEQVVEDKVTQDVFGKLEPSTTDESVIMAMSDSECKNNETGNGSHETANLESPKTNTCPKGSADTSQSTEINKNGQYKKDNTQIEKSEFTAEQNETSVSNLCSTEHTPNIRIKDGIEINPVNEEGLKIKNEPEWLKFGYTQEPDVIFLSDDDEMMIMSFSVPVISLGSDSNDDMVEDVEVEDIKSPKLEKSDRDDLDNFSSPDDGEDQGSDFEPKDIFSSVNNIKVSILESENGGSVSLTHLDDSNVYQAETQVDTKSEYNDQFCEISHEEADEDEHDDYADPQLQAYFIQTQKGYTSVDRRRYLDQIGLNYDGQSFVDSDNVQWNETETQADSLAQKYSKDIDELNTELSNDSQNQINKLNAIKNRKGKGDLVSKHVKYDTKGGKSGMKRMDLPKGNTQSKVITDQVGILKRPTDMGGESKAVDFQEQNVKKPRLDIPAKKAIVIEPQKMKSTAEKRESAKSSIPSTPSKIAITEQKSTVKQFTVLPRPVLQAEKDKDLVIVDANKSDMWLSKQSTKNKEKKTESSKGKNEKRKRRRSKEDPSEELKWSMAGARSRLAERNMQSIVNPNIIADPATKRMKPAPVNSVETEDVDLPSHNQVIRKGLPLLNPMGLFSKKKEPMSSQSENVTESTKMSKDNEVRIASATKMTCTVTIATATTSSSVSSTNISKTVATVDTNKEKQSSGQSDKTKTVRWNLDPVELNINNSTFSPSTSSIRNSSTTNDGSSAYVQSSSKPESSPCTSAAGLTTGSDVSPVIPKTLPCSNGPSTSSGSSSSNYRSSPNNASYYRTSAYLAAPSTSSGHSSSTSRTFPYVGGPSTSTSTSSNPEKRHATFQKSVQGTNLMQKIPLTSTASSDRPPDGIVNKNTELQWDHCLRVILKWSPNWFEEREKLTGSSSRYAKPPPVTNDLGGHDRHQLFPLVERYNSFDEYSDNFMLPLLLHETWENCYSTWREKKSRGQINQRKFIFNQQASAGEKLLLYTLQGLISKNERLQGRFVNEGELIQLNVFGDLRFKEKAEERWYKIMGFVERVVFPETSVSKICANNEEMSRLRKPDSISIKMLVRIRLRSFFPKDNVLVCIQEIGSLINLKRQFQGLAYLPKSPLCRDLLFPTNSPTYCDKAAAIITGLRGEYNESQSLAINTAANIASLQKNLPRICLLQGPPGTGKSHTIVGIITKIVQDTGGKCRICLCAPSIAAVDELLRRLHRENDKNKQETVKLVRLGKKSSIHPDVQSLCLESLVQKAHKEDMLRQLPQSLQGERKTLANKIKETKENIKTATEQFQSQKLETYLIKLEKQQSVLDRKCTVDMSKIPIDVGKEKQIRMDLLHKANVVAGTLSSMGNQYIKTFFQSNIINQQVVFDCVIIDEATQAIELDTLIPLQYGTTKLILVGDPEQLPPTVLSQTAQENKFNMSLFERLDSHFKFSKNFNPVIFLDTQYRMDKEIMMFPNKYIYDRKLQNHQSVLGRQFPLVPYLLYDITEGKEQFSPTTKSISNMAEAKFTAELCKFIVAKTTVTEMMIGIIAPYTKQKELIVGELQQRGLKNIEVSTVDGFQGREKDVIVMSCVRANATGADRNRMNVSLTRAKHAMYLVGRFDSLQSSDEWKPLISDAGKRKKIVSVQERYTEQAVRQCLKRNS